MILREMSETLPFAVFKGGTSLSKCYRVIKRFSEDIDLTADIPLSQGQKKKMKYSLIDVVHKLGLNVINLDETRSRRDYNRYEIAYDSVFSSYYNSISSVIMLETSFTACSFPTVIMPVESMVGDMLKAEAPELLEKYELNAFRMKVQGLDRTLVQEVRTVRKPSLICLSAKDGVDIPALLTEIIRNEVYREDYRNLTEKLLEEKVDYDTAVTALKRIAAGGMFA